MINKILQKVREKPYQVSELGLSSWRVERVKFRKKNGKILKVHQSNASLLPLALDLSHSR